MGGAGRASWADLLRENEPNGGDHPPWVGPMSRRTASARGAALDVEGPGRERDQAAGRAGHARLEHADASRALDQPCLGREGAPGPPRQAVDLGLDRLA